MAKGYWVANNVITDHETYEKYKANNADILPPYNARFLARGGQQQIREGDAYGRTVILEFDSYEDAIACYESKAYQENKLLRDTAADTRLIIVEGY